MTTTYTELPDQKTIELVVDGKITRDDFDRIKGPLEHFIEANGTIKMLEVIKDFRGFEPSVIYDGIKFDIKHIRHISHCAVVSDMGWLSPLSKAAGALMSTKLRTFTLDQTDDARAWLRNPN